MAKQTLTSTSTKLQPPIQWPCVFYTPVRALSTLVWDKIHTDNGNIRTWGQFHRAINLVLNDDMLLALVRPEVGKGPFHIVVDTLPTISLSKTVPFWWEGDLLRMGPWALDFGRRPTFWDPLPPWNLLSLHPDRLVELHHLTYDAARAHPAPSPILRHFLGVIHPAIIALGHALSHNEAQAIATATIQLAGLGPGLTPSGDDFLAGVMVGLWVKNRESRIEEQALRIPNYKSQDVDYRSTLATCHLLFAVAATRTTRLSRAFLHAASRGNVDERWHKLLHALTGENPEVLARATDAIINFGAHSGLDMLTGFLWIVQGEAQEPCVGGKLGN